MRNKWAHEMPALCQQAPADNTSKFVDRQVFDWVVTGIPIHPEIAMEIASWYASPGVDDGVFSRFGQVGEVRPGLAEKVISVMNATEAYLKASEGVTDTEREFRRTLAALRALLAYVTAI